MTAGLRLVQGDLGMAGEPLRLAGEPLRLGGHRRDGGGPLLGGPVSYRDGSGEPVTSLVPQALTEHLSWCGQRPAAVGAAGAVLLGDVRSTGLTGHGGGHFPVADKWLAALGAGGGGVVIANGAEGEPGSVKDRALLQLRPHLVLDGLASAAELVDADEVVIWLCEDDLRTRRAVEGAVAERRSAGLSEPAPRVVTGPARYVSGESSAIISSVAGGPALPRFRREPAARAGDDGRPALVHNVETLAMVGRVARLRSHGYRPTTLLSIAHGDRRTVVEVDPSAALEEVVGAVTGPSLAEPPQALLIGGYGGTWLSWQELSGVSASESSLRAKGLSLGAGVLIPVAADECGLSQACEIAAYLAASSARQCGPCLFGLRSVADVLAELVDGHARGRDLARLDRYLGEISGRGACHHPDGAVRMIRSAIATFATDVESHLRSRRCLYDDKPAYVRVAGVVE
jgi:NADH:ubiquinone oxidoreductase subunit F (NADH-binding)